MKGVHSGLTQSDSRCVRFLRYWLDTEGGGALALFWMRKAEWGRPHIIREQWLLLVPVIACPQLNFLCLENAALPARDNPHSPPCIRMG